MAGRVSKTSSRNEQVSLSDSSSRAGKTARGEAKGLTILVLDDNGKFALARRKTGVVVSIKRLAVRVAVLFSGDSSSENRAHWNEVFGVDQDIRAAKAVDAFMTSFTNNPVNDAAGKHCVVIREQESGGTKSSGIKVGKHHMAIGKQDFSNVILANNLGYKHIYPVGPSLLRIRNTTKDAEDKGTVAMTAAIAKTIILNTKHRPDDSEWVKDDMTSRLNEFKDLLTIKDQTEFDQARKEIEAEISTKLPSCMKKLADNDEPTDQVKNLQELAKKITAFIAATPCAESKSQEFCTLLVKGVLAGRSSSPARLSREEGKDVASRFVEIFSAGSDDELEEQDKHYRSKVGLEAGSQAVVVLLDASREVLGPDGYDATEYMENHPSLNFPKLKKRA